MLRMTIAAMALGLAGSAEAATCRGLFIHNSQGYEFGSRRPNLVKAGPLARSGTEALFVGESTIRGRVYFMVASSHMYPGADVQLPTGCKLDDLDPSEPD